MEQMRMKFKYRIGTKIFVIIVFLIWSTVLYLILIDEIKGIHSVIGILFWTWAIIYNLYTLVINRPVELTDEGIGYYVGKELKYFCEWNKIHKVMIPYYDIKHDVTIKLYCPDRVIRIGTDIVTEEGKRGAEIIIEYIKKHVDSFKIEDKKEEWRNRIGEKGDAEFHSWIKGAK